MKEHIEVNTSDLLDSRREALPSAYDAPAGGQEDDVAGSDQLLQRPSSSEPSAFQESLRIESVINDIFVMHVAEVGVADPSMSIPRVHGVDGF